MFDSYNGKKGQGLSSIITTTSNHLEFWEKAYNKLRRMEYVDKNTHMSIRKNAPKCLINWMWNIEGTKHLWNMLRNEEFLHLDLRYINQDPIENYFGQIRSNGHRNTNPSPNQFGCVFKTLVTANLTSCHSISSNCEKNKEGSSLALLQMFRASEIAEAEIERTIDCAEAAIPEISCKDLIIDYEKIITNIIRDKSLLQCTDCIKQIRSEPILQSIQQAIDLAEVHFASFCHNIKIHEKLQKFLDKETFLIPDMHCPTLRLVIIRETARQFIIEWCKFINKILCGKIQHQNYSNFMYNEAQRMASRYVKKK